MPLGAGPQSQHGHVRQVGPLPLGHGPAEPLLAAEQGPRPPQRPGLVGEPGDETLDERHPDAGVTAVHAVQGVQVGVSIRVLVEEEPQVSSPSSSPRNAPTTSMTFPRPCLR